MKKLALFRLWFAVLACLLSSSHVAGAADSNTPTSATLLNPQPNDTLSALAFLAYYRLNGTCRNAEEVYIYTYRDNALLHESVIAAKVQHGTWSAEWFPSAVADGTSINYKILVVPVKRTVKSDRTITRTLGTFKTAGSNFTFALPMGMDLTEPLDSPTNAGFTPTPSPVYGDLVTIKTLNVGNAYLGLDLLPGRDPANVYVGKTVAPNLIVPLQVQIRPNSAGIIPLNLQAFNSSGVAAGAAQSYSFDTTQPLISLNASGDTVSADQVLPNLIFMGASTLPSGRYSARLTYGSETYQRHVLFDNGLPTGTAALTQDFDSARQLLLLSGTATDAESGINRVYAVIRSLTGTPDPTLIPAQLSDHLTSVEWKININLTGYTSGAYALTVYAVDEAGNAAAIYTSPTGGISIDLTAPTLSNAAATASGANAVFTANSNETVGVTYRVFDGNPGSNFNAPVQIVASGTTSANAPNIAPAAFPLKDGAHSLYVLARDSAGNVSAPIAPATVTLDTTPPILGITSPTGKIFRGGTANGSVSIAGAVTDIISSAANIRVKVFNGNPSSFGDAALATVTGSAFPITFDVNSATAPFPLPEGTRTITVWAQDAAGNLSAKETFTIIVDRTPPVPTFTTPAVGTRGGTEKIVEVRGASTDSGNADADNALTWSLIAPGGGTVTGAGATFRYAWDISTFGTTAASPQTLSLTATDKAGNTSAAVTRIITVDNAAPTVSWTTAPEANAFVGGSFTLTGAATDDSAVTWQYLLDGNVIAGTPGSVSPFVSTGAPDGTHIFTYKATDSLGNTKSISRVLIVDNTDPSVVVASPPSGKLAAGDFVTATIRDLHLPASPAAALVTFQELDANNAPTGALYPALDSAGNATGIIKEGAPSTDGSTYKMLDMGRTVAEVKARLPLALASKAKVRVVVAAKDTARINDVANTGNDASGQMDSAVNVSGTLNLAGITLDGTSAPKGKTSGKFYLKSGLYKVNGTAAIVSQKSYKVSATKGSSTVVLKDAQTASAAGELAELNAATLTEGEWTIALTATNVVNQTTTAEATFTVVIDKTLPTATITAPASGAFLSTNAAPVVIETTLTSALSSEDAPLTYRVQAGSMVLPGNAENPGSGELTQSPKTLRIPLNTLTLPEGATTIKVIATDRAGNINATTEIPVTIDNVKPAIAGISLENGQLVSGINRDRSQAVAVGATVSDATAIAWAVFLDDVSKATGTGSAVSYPWNSSTSPDGSHVIRIRATDAAGNVQEIVRTITSDNTRPVLTLTAPVRYTGHATSTDFNIRTPGLVAGGNGNKDNRNPVVVLGSMTDANPGTWGIAVFDNSNSLLAVQTGNQGGTISYLWQTTDNPSDGLRKIRIDAADKAGNSDFITQTVFVDNSPPQIGNFTLTPGAVGGNHAGRQTLAVPLTDASRAAWIVRIVRADGAATELARGFINTSPASAPSQILWDTTKFANGQYVISIEATDELGNAGSKSSQIVTVANNSPSAELRLTQPQAYDEFGATAANPYSSNNLPKTLYVGSGYTLDVRVKDANNWLLNMLLNGNVAEWGGLVYPRAGTTGADLSFRQEFPYSSEGRAMYSLTASNVTSTSAPAPLDIVQDTEAPLLRLTSLPGSENAPFVAAPDSLLAVEFAIENPVEALLAKTPNVGSLSAAQKDQRRQQLRRLAAPLQRNAPDQNLPDLLMEIRDTQTGTRVDYAFNLSAAVLSPNLALPNGSASVTGDATMGYRVNWQIRLDSSKFTAGRKYEITLSRVKDVAQNRATEVKAYFSIPAN